MNYTNVGAPTLMAQAPNRKGNTSKTVPHGHNKGVTAITGANKRQVSQPAGAQGAPKSGGNCYPSSSCGPVSVSKPKESYGNNDSYRNGSNYKK